MSKFKRLFRIISFAKPGKGLLTIIALLSIAGAASSIIFPLITGNLVDSFKQVDSISTYWGLMIAGILIAGTIASGFNFYLIGTVANRMLVNLRAKVLHKSIYLPVTYYDNNNSADPASRIVNDTEVINSVVSQHFEPFISGMLTMVSSLVILWILDWQLTAVLFGTLIVSFAVTIPVASKLTGLSKSTQEQEAKFLGFVTERLSQIRLIKASNAEQESLKQSKSNLDSLYDLGQKMVKIGAIMAPISGITIVSALIAVLAFGAARVADGAISMGDLVAFILYLFNIVFPLVQLTIFIAALNKAAGAADRVDELLSQDDETSQQQKAAEAKSGDLVIKNLRFNYSESNQLFDRLNLEIQQKQTVAFVGESGSGKSTLFSLLLRYYSPTGGELLVDGTSINDFSLTDWRNQIAYISQDTPILSGTIRENLVLGLIDTPNDEAIIKALNLAQLESLLATLPEGLESQVGERGVKLSGGQKQRLAIARAILQDCPILLCDEATSNLDSATEYKIQAAMNELSKGRTTIVAAHRLSTVRDADQIIVLKAGEIIGQGNHETLYQTLPYYKELVDIQFLNLSSSKSCETAEGAKSTPIENSQQGASANT